VLIFEGTSQFSRFTTTAKEAILLVEGIHSIRAPRDRVWASLNDPRILARCVPGVKVLEPDGEDKYRAQIELAVGPVKGKFDGKVAITEKVMPESMTLQIDAKAPVGIVSAIGRLKLEQTPEGTNVHWSGEPKLAGMLASLGGRLIQGAAKQQADAFFTKIETESQA
jgi:uncharacterized protein